MYSIQYCYKFYLNAFHALWHEENLETPHSHTWEIILHFEMAEGRLCPKEELEVQIEKILDRFQDQYLNEMDPFLDLPADLEHICSYFYSRFRALLDDKGWKLLQMEVSEGTKYSYILINEQADEDLEDLGQSGWNQLSEEETELIKIQVKEAIKRMAKG